MTLSIVAPECPDPGQLAAVRALIASLSEADGRDPLSDQALTRLTSAAVEHRLAYDGDALVGYAQRAGDSLEIAAGTAAAGALIAEFADRRVLVWSHGTASPLAPALAAAGFVRARELHQMRRPLTGPIDVPPLPDGVVVRPFVVGEDEAEWLRVNAAAFTALPDQGGLTRSDLEAREAESWFDADGFLLAWRGSTLAGFHWTKVHPDGAGEVYVIAVDPAARGLRLGSALLQLGLAHLKAIGCPEVLLYVDGANIAAMALYERTGFRDHDLDVQWRSPTG